MKIIGKLVEKVNLRDNENNYLIVLQGKYGLFNAVTNETTFIDRLIQNEDRDSYWQLDLSQVVVREDGQVKIKEYLDNVTLIDDFKIEQVKPEEIVTKTALTKKQSEEVQESSNTQDQKKEASENLINIEQQVDREKHSENKDDNGDSVLVLDKVNKYQSKNDEESVALANYEKNKHNGLAEIEDENDDDSEELTDDKYVAFDTGRSQTQAVEPKKEENKEVSLDSLDNDSTSDNIENNKIDNKENTDIENNSATSETSDDEYDPEDEDDNFDDGTEIPADLW